MSCSAYRVPCPILSVQFCLSCSAYHGNPFCLFRSACPVLPVLCACPFLIVQFCLSCLPVLSCLSCSSFPVLPVLFCPSRSTFPDLPVPFWMPCSAYSTLNVLFCLSCSACPVLPALFCRSCPGFPVLVFLSLLYSTVELFDILTLPPPLPCSLEVSADYHCITIANSTFILAIAPWISHICKIALSHPAPNPWCPTTRAGREDQSETGNWRKS